MFKIHRSADKKYYVTLQGANNEILYTSEMLDTKQSAKRNIEAVYRTVLAIASNGYPDNVFLKDLTK